MKVGSYGVAYTGLLVHNTIKRTRSESLTATWVPVEMEEANRAMAKVPGKTLSSWEEMLPAEPDTLKNILWNQTKNNSNCDGCRSDSQRLLLFFQDCKSQGLEKPKRYGRTCKKMSDIRIHPWKMRARKSSRRARPACLLFQDYPQNSAHVWHIREI